MRGEHKISICLTMDSRLDRLTQSSVNLPSNDSHFQKLHCSLSATVRRPESQQLESLLHDLLAHRLLNQTPLRLRKIAVEVRTVIALVDSELVHTLIQLISDG